jgi:hypothetical protein
MPTSGQPLLRPKPPGVLWEAVLSARKILADQRRQPPGPVVTEAREALLGALEEYAASLAAAGRPIPYLLGDELRVQRRTVRPRSRFGQDSSVNW